MSQTLTYKVAMKYFKIVPFFLLIYSSSQLSACQNFTIPMDVIGVILPHTSFNFARNLVQTCKYFNPKYNVTTQDGLPTDLSCLDQILLKNHEFCSRLTDSIHLKCLIRYATHGSEPKRELFDYLRDHATTHQKKLDESLQSLVINQEPTFIYQGKENLGIFKEVPLLALPALITICSTTTKSYQSLSSLLLNAIIHKQQELIDNLINKHPELLSDNNRAIKNSKSFFLKQAVIKKNISAVKCFLPFCSTEIDYLHAIVSASAPDTHNLLEILINHCITKNTLTPAFIADILSVVVICNTREIDYTFLTNLLKQESNKNYYKALPIMLDPHSPTKVWKQIFFDPYFDSNTPREEKLYDLLYEKNHQSAFVTNSIPFQNIMSYNGCGEKALLNALKNSQRDKSIYWLLKHPKINLYTLNSGERVLANLLNQLSDIDILKEVPLYKVKKLSYLGLKCCMVQYYKSFLLSTVLLFFFVNKYL